MKKKRVSPFQASTQWKTASVSTPIGMWWVVFEDTGVRQLGLQRSEGIPDGMLPKVWLSVISDIAQGRKPQNTVPLLPTGTPFQLAVWNVLHKIPHGQTLTYGEVAQRIGRPTAARAVGTACGANPLPLLIPCHRVLRSSGHLGGYSLGLSLKKQLLNSEISL